MPGATVVVTLGGGSVMDAGKALAMLGAQPVRRAGHSRYILRSRPVTKTDCVEWSARTRVFWNTAGLRRAELYTARLSLRAQLAGSVPSPRTILFR